MIINIEKQMPRIFSLAIGMVLIFGISGCGGSSSDNTGTSSSVSGVVIDGYIANAMVCLDLNKNYLCDVEEPSTTSNSKGAYTLTFSGSTDNQIILAQVFANSKDADDGGKTMDEANRTGYTLAAPAIQASVITPLTTLVTLDLLTKLDASITATRISTSEKLVQIALNNSDSIMGFDFVKAGNLNTHNLAQVITAILPEVQMRANTTLSDQAAASISNAQVLQQVNYRGMRDGIYAVLERVIDISSHDALKFPLATAMLNATYSSDILGVTGSGTDITLGLIAPPRSYFDGNASFYPNACAQSLTNLECFEFQLFSR